MTDIEKKFNDKFAEVEKAVHQLILSKFPEDMHSHLKEEASSIAAHHLLKTLGDAETHLSDCLSDRLIYHIFG